MEVIQFSRKRNVPSPKSALLDGAQILTPLLGAKGFKFRFLREGKGSGGAFASGEFVHGDRRLELHFRYSLGLVRYHVGKQNASHEYYMRELGVWDDCKYPGFSDNYGDAFEGLAHDLIFADDFLVGSAEKLRRAAAREESAEASRKADLAAGYAGDKEKIGRLHESFHQKHYDEVVKLASALKYPDQLSEPENKMVEISKKKAAAHK